VFFTPRSQDLVNHGSATSAPDAALIQVEPLSMRERLLPVIFLGGAAGGLARAVLERAWPASGHGWPWVTFSVNIAGTALLASLMLLAQRWPASSAYLGPLLGVGLCGALTTFSTLQLETVVLVRGGHAVLGAAYGLGSIGAGLLIAYAVTGLVGGKPAR
jgi:CrcB protein